jgi:hypothetical protein
MTTAGMIQDILPRRMMAQIRDFQDGQDSGIRTDAAVVNLTSQPLAHGFTARLAGGDPAARRGKGVYGLRP